MLQSAKVRPARCQPGNVAQSKIRCWTWQQKKDSTEKLLEVGSKHCLTLLPKIQLRIVPEDLTKKLLKIVYEDLAIKQMPAGLLPVRLLLRLAWKLLFATEDSTEKLLEVGSKHCLTLLPKIQLRIVPEDLTKKLLKIAYEDLVIKQIPVRLFPVWLLPVGLLPVGLLPVGLLPVGLLPVGLLPVGLLPVRLLPVRLLLWFDRKLLKTGSEDSTEKLLMKIW